MTTKASEDLWKGEGTFIHCCWEWELVQPLWKSLWSFLKDLGLGLAQDPAISWALFILLQKYFLICVHCYSIHNSYKMGTA